MTTTIEKIGDNKLSLTIEIPKEDVNSVLSKVCIDFSRKVKIPGFRQGKVPKNVIHNFVGKEAISQEAKEILIKQGVSSAISENDIDIISIPEITDIGNIEENKPFKFKVVAEIKPEVKLPLYKNLILKKKRQEINDIQIDKHLQIIREQKAILIPVEDRGIQKGDVVFIDYYGTVDGKDFQKNIGENVKIEIGKETFLKELEEKLIGAKTNEEKEIKVKIDKNFANPEIADKEVDFKIKIREIKQKQLPDITSFFARELGYEDIDDLRKKIKERLEELEKQSERENLKKQIIEILFDTAEANISETLINYEKNRLLNNLAQNLKTQGFNPDDYITPFGLKDTEKQKEIDEIAKKNVKISLTLESIAKQENITVSDEEVEKEVLKIARLLGQTKESVYNYLKQQDNLSGLKKEIIQEKTFDFIIDNSKFLYIEGEENL